MCIVSTLLGHKLSTGPHIGQLTMQISTCLLWFSVRCISWRPSCKLPVCSWEQAFLLGLNIMIFVPKVFEYLPPANKVWGKVIFSQACVKNSVHGGGCLLGGGAGRGVPALGGLVLGGLVPGGCLVPGGMSAPRGACSWGAWLRPPTANTAGGKHPTGMHSCLKIRPFCFPTFFVCLKVKCSQTAALNKNAFQ